MADSTGVQQVYAPPGAPVRDPGQAPVRLTIKQIWFSFEGRIPRQAFWVQGTLATIAIAIVAMLICAGALAVAVPLGILLYIPTVVFMFWTSLAIGVKRWHDLGHSGWMHLLFLIPIVGFLCWIYLGFFRGNDGENRFGPDGRGAY